MDKTTGSRQADSSLVLPNHQVSRCAMPCIEFPTTIRLMNICICERCFFYFFSFCFRIIMGFFYLNDNDNHAVVSLHIVTLRQLIMALPDIIIKRGFMSLFLYIYF